MHGGQPGSRRGQVRGRGAGTGSGFRVAARQPQGPGEGPGCRVRIKAYVKTHWMRAGHAGSRQLWELMHVWLTARLPACALACVCACMRAGMCGCLRACLREWLPACALACVPACVVACVRACVWGSVVGAWFTHVLRMHGYVLCMCGCVCGKDEAGEPSLVQPSLW